VSTTAQGIENKLAELEKKLATKFHDMGNKINDLEKNTIWKIKDCEDLLKSRVSERYVTDAIDKIQENISNEV
jgi:hypothetical protein